MPFVLSANQMMLLRCRVGYYLKRLNITSRDRLLHELLKTAGSIEPKRKVRESAPIAPWSWLDR